jgi:hypothetical protein
LPISLYSRSNSCEVKLPIVGYEILEPFSNLLNGASPLEPIPEVLTEESQPVKNHRTASDIFNLSQEEFRPSSRVLSIPGGKTNNIFGSTEETIEVLHKPKVMGPPSTLNLFDPEVDPLPKPANRRDPNWSGPADDNRTERRHSLSQNISQVKLGGDNDELPEFHPSRRMMNNALAESEENVTTVTGRKHYGDVANATHFSFGESETELPATRTGNRRDPNALSSGPTERPSSRFYLLTKCFERTRWKNNL